MDKEQVQKFTIEELTELIERCWKLSEDTGNHIWKHAYNELGYALDRIHAYTERSSTCMVYNDNGTEAYLWHYGNKFTKI